MERERFPPCPLNFLRFLTKGVRMRKVTVVAWQETANWDVLRNSSPTTRQEPTRRGL